MLIGLELGSRAGRAPPAPEVPHVMRWCRLPSSRCCRIERCLHGVDFFRRQCPAVGAAAVDGIASHSVDVEQQVSRSLDATSSTARFAVRARMPSIARSATSAADRVRHVSLGKSVRGGTEPPSGSDFRSSPSAAQSCCGNRPSCGYPRSTTSSSSRRRALSMPGLPSATKRLCIAAPTRSSHRDQRIEVVVERIAERRRKHHRSTARSDDGCT